MDKKEKIIEAALRLFVDNGFHGTPTSKIAQEAGVANGTLFQYFKTKDELVVALYISVKENMAEFIEKNNAKSDNLKEVMKSQFLASLFWALDNMVKFRFIQQFHTSPYVGKIEQDIIQNQLIYILNTFNTFNTFESILSNVVITDIYNIIQF